MKICMYAQKLFNPFINAKTIKHMHPALQKTIIYAQKIEREFLLVKEIWQTKFDMVMSIDASTNNNPMRKQRLANITCYKCRQKSLQKRLSYLCCEKSRPDQNMQVHPYNPPTTVTQTVTVFYFVPQSNLVTIIKELAKTKQTTWQFKRNVQSTQMNQGDIPQSVVYTKLTVMPMASTLNLAQFIRMQSGLSPGLVLNPSWNYYCC